MHVSDAGARSDDPRVCVSARQCNNIDMLAFTVILVITILCALGTQGSARFNLAMVSGFRRLRLRARQAPAALVR